MKVSPYISVLLFSFIFAQSCQKQKLEKLSGKWKQDYQDDNEYEFFPDQYKNIRFECDSFYFDREICDDVFYISCQCNCWTYKVKGVYKLDHSTLVLDGIYPEYWDEYKDTTVNINPSNRDDTAPYYHQELKAHFLGKTLNLEKQIFDSKGAKKKWLKESDIECDS